MTKYSYIVLPAGEVKGILSAVDPDMPDAFLADDYAVRELRRLHEAGYRWVRTDGDHAVFELCTHETPEIVKQLLGQNVGRGTRSTLPSYRCETCQETATVHIEAIGCHFCESCLKKIDERIAGRGI